MSVLNQYSHQETLSDSVSSTGEAKNPDEGSFQADILVIMHKTVGEKMMV